MNGRSSISRKKIGLLGLSLALSYGLGELLTRLIVPDPAFRHENRIEMWQPDPLVGYKNKINFHDFAYGFVLEETNSRGYRGPEVSIPKPPGVFRILGLGDSVTWGTGVPDGQTHLRLLEKMLNERAVRNPGLRFEAVNTGVVGYSTHQERLTMERDAPLLCPDVATIGYTPNDFYPTEDPFFNVHTFHQPANPNVHRFE